MKTVILYGLRRSGNHFLISLILQQFSNYVHINDTTLSYNEYTKYIDIKKSKDRTDGKWTGFKDVDCLVISIENQIIDISEIEKFHKIKNFYFIMLLRSPYSHFSSVWKIYNKNKNNLTDIVKLWKEYAKFFINNNNSINNNNNSINNNNNNNIIKVIYDKLSCNENYMIDIIKKLDINNINIDKNFIIPYQKSSFGSDIKHIRQTYKTIQDCVYRDDDKFLNLINDKEIHDLWDTISKMEN